MSVASILTETTAKQADDGKKVHSIYDKVGTDYNAAKEVKTGIASSASYNETLIHQPSSPKFRQVFYRNVYEVIAQDIY